MPGRSRLVEFFDEPADTARTDTCSLVTGGVELSKMERADIEIREARSESDEAEAAELLAAYLSWGSEQLREQYGVDEAPADPAHVRHSLNDYRAPSGSILVAYSAGRAVGVGALRKLPDGAAEIKRMFVIPEARSLGIGSLLLDRLLDSAAETGATVVRLDTAGFMSAAHRLYRSRGFIERKPYEGTEIPEHLYEHWLFFERRLIAP
jgi:GNAT superfamily N-acetyltransferase